MCVLHCVLCVALCVASVCVSAFIVFVCGFEGVVRVCVCGEREGEEGRDGHLHMQQLVVAMQ